MQCIDDENDLAGIELDEVEDHKPCHWCEYYTIDLPSRDNKCETCKDKSNYSPIKKEKK